MINIKSEELKKLMKHQPTLGTKYHHHLVQDLGIDRSGLVSVLQKLAAIAHEDAKKYLRKNSVSLDPLGEDEDNEFDPAEGYPEIFDMTTLKGYLGEMMCGVFIENYSPFNQNWKVPVFSFRFHEVAFDQLEIYHQTQETPGSIPGRTGDDCVAFQLNNQNKIEKVIFAEAKCSGGHRSASVNEAHEKVSNDLKKPVELRRLVLLLSEYNDEESIRWTRALDKYRFSKNTNNVERYDLVSYVCGRHPVKSTTWINTIKPNGHYKGDRVLAVVEMHFNKVEELISKVYGKKV